MNANEVPEKIYIDDFGSELSYDWHTEHCYENDIEYIRKDVFLEEACEWLRKGGNGWYFTSEFGEDTIDFIKLAENFKKYMEGE